MKISNILVAAAIVLSSFGGFSASVTKKNYDDLNGNDDVVVDVDLSGISGGADTNAVNDLIGEYDRTNLTGRIERKRDKTDMKVYRKVKDCWSWKNWNNPEEPLAREAPDDFLALANSPASDPIFFRNGAWWGAVQYWPNGKVKYSQSNIPPAGTGEFSTTLNFAMFAYDETGTNEIYRFGATATRTDPTNETVVAWDETHNGYVRIATTDIVDDSVRRGVTASTNGLASVAYVDSFTNGLASVAYVDSATNGLRKVDGASRPLPRYLHFQRFDDSYKDDAEWYYSYVTSRVGSCSARRVGNVLERNYDWLYDNAATFVIEMSEGPGRFASLGVASCGENLSEDFVNSGRWSRFYKCLPGRTIDGVNSRGVAINVNVVVTNGVAEWEHHVPGDGRDIDSQWAVRFVLDNAPDAEWAATNLANRVFISAATLKQGFSVHYAIIDKDSTWLVEDGQAFRWNGRIALAVTNFRLTYGSSISQFKSNDPYGSGYERYSVLAGAGSSITQVWYSTAYRRGPDGNFPWPTEFSGEIGPDGQKIKCTEESKLQEWAKANIPVGAPEIFPRGVGTWQTVHTSIYDIEEKTLRMAVQEKDDWYVFALPGTRSLPDDRDRLAANERFRGAVRDVQERAPDKWALSNITNSNGKLISANDVRAFSIDGSNETTNWYHYMFFRKASDRTVNYGYLEFGIEREDGGSPFFQIYDYTHNDPRMIRIDCEGIFYNKDWDGHTISYDNILMTYDVEDEINWYGSLASMPVNSTAVHSYLFDESPNWGFMWSLKQLFPTFQTLNGYLTTEDAQSTYRKKAESLSIEESDARYLNPTSEIAKVYSEDKATYQTGDGQVYKRPISYYWTLDDTYAHHVWTFEPTGVSNLWKCTEKGFYVTGNDSYMDFGKRGSVGVWKIHDNTPDGEAPDFCDANEDSTNLNFQVGKATRHPIFGNWQKVAQVAYEKPVTQLWNANETQYIDGDGAVYGKVDYWRSVDPAGVTGDYAPSATEANAWLCPDYQVDYWCKLYFVSNDPYYHRDGWYFDIYLKEDDTRLTHRWCDGTLTSETLNFEGTIYKFTRRHSQEKVRQVAFTDEVVESAKRYAMFIINLNDASYANIVDYFTQFELKASTNNFSASASQKDRCCFYSHSGYADEWISSAGNNDQMRLFLNHGGADQRSYVKIANTAEGMPTNYAPAEVIVIVDPHLVNTERSDGTWLYKGNEDIVWTWVRTKYGQREFDAGTDRCLWRPIAPVRWFSKLPAWAE